MALAKRAGIVVMIAFVIVWPPAPSFNPCHVPRASRVAKIWVHAVRLCHGPWRGADPFLHGRCM